MNNKNYILLICAFFMASIVFAQKKDDLKIQYINMYKDIAIRQMNEHRIPASITLAQGILESNAATSRLALKGNNHFGIKCHKDWQGKRMYKNDDAFGECFRKYDNPEASFRDHSIFLSNRNRYKFLFDLNITDYKGWAHGLKKAGYATNPNYAHLLIKIIEEYELYLFDKPGAEDVIVKRESGEERKEIEEKVNINAQTVLSDKNIVFVTQKNGRNIYKKNGKKLIIVMPNDTFWKISKDMNVKVNQLIKWNDYTLHQKIFPNEYLYIENKRWKSKSSKKHVVKTNETWHSISQYYGVRVAWLQLYNLKLGRLKRGDVIKLRN